MKMQLPPPNNLSIANSRPSYSTPQQRQGTFVTRPLRDLVKDAQQANPELKAVLRKIRALRDGLKIDVQFIDGEYIFQTLDKEEGIPIDIYVVKSNLLNADLLLHILRYKLKTHNSGTIKWILEEKNKLR